MFDKRITGYCDRLSVQPGESVGFKVSSEVPGHYRADLVRIDSGDDHPGGPGLKVTTIDSSVSGVCSGFWSSLIHPAEAWAASMLKRRVERTWLTSKSTNLGVEGTMILAVGFSFVTSDRTF